MYFCPNGCANDGPEAFNVQAETRGFATIAADGTETGFYPRQHLRVGTVVCGDCQAAAEWRDARQEELFAVEPAMFG